MSERVTLTCTPNPAEVGQVVAASAVVVNDGIYSGHYWIGFYLNDELKEGASLEFDISAGYKKTLSYSFTMPNLAVVVWADVLEWRIDELTGQFKWFPYGDDTEVVNIEAVPVPESEFRSFGVTEYNKV